MTNEDWKIGLKKEQEFLDTIDILNLIKSQNIDDLDILRFYIEDLYDEEFIFNYMDTYEFMLYLRERYSNENIRFKEEETQTYYKIYRSKDKNNDRNRKKILR